MNFLGIKGTFNYPDLLKAADSLASQWYSITKDIYPMGLLGRRVLLTELPS